MEAHYVKLDFCIYLLMNVGTERSVSEISIRIIPDNMIYQNLLKQISTCGFPNKLFVVVYICFVYVFS
jgi:hypothetical protein